MSGTIRGGQVPIVFSYRRVTEQPTIKRIRRFIGWKRMFGTLLHRALEWVEELAYEVEREVEEAGREEVVHYALQVDDPWGPNHQSHLVVTRLPERIAGCLNFEIIQFAQEQAQESDAPVHARRPANFEQARARMASMLEREEQFVPEPPLPPQPAPQYAPPHDPPCTPPPYADQSAPWNGDGS